MIAVGLAAVSALSYGASDFTGAVASKKNDATVVTVAVQAVSLIALGAIIVVFPSGRLIAVDLVWGAVGGLGTALGLVMFYKALALGPMSVAAALTALWSSAIPVVTGLALGDRPGAVTLVGIGVAIPSAVLVSIEGGDGGAALGATPRERAARWRQQARTRLLAVVAGIGFGLFFVALSRTSPDAGLHPLLGARAASISGLTIALVASKHRSGFGARWWPTIVLAGLLDCAANSFYLGAVQLGSLTWVAAISSLYPVSTVLLARVVLGERLGRVQIGGLGTAAAALVLVGIGAT